MPDFYNIHLKGDVGGPDFNAKAVDDILSENKDKQVNVLIDSLGGSLDTALSISAAFSRHGHVKVHFTGMNASAATIASMGAEFISIDTNAMYLVHKISLPFAADSLLNADEMSALADELAKKAIDLQKLDITVAAMYAKKCRREPKDLLDLMKSGGWLTAAEALNWGFVDKVTEDEDQKAPSLSAKKALALVDAGIPIPNINIDKNPEPTRSALARCFNAIYKALFNTEKKEMEAPQTPRILEILGIQSIPPDADGNFILTSDQLLAIENFAAAAAQALADKDNIIADLQNKLDEANNRIKERDKEPADKTTAVIQADRQCRHRSQIDEFTDAVNEANKAYNRLKGIF